MSSIEEGAGPNLIREKITTVCAQLIVTKFLGCKNFIHDWFDRRHKKQDEEELNKQTLYNFCLHTNNDYSFLFEKMKSTPLKKASEKEDTYYSFLLEKIQSPPLKEAFERGIKERQNRSRRS